MRTVSSSFSSSSLSQTKEVILGRKFRKAKLREVLFLFVKTEQITTTIDSHAPASNTGRPPRADKEKEEEKRVFERNVSSSSLSSLTKRTRRANSSFVSLEILSGEEESESVFPPQQTSPRRRQKSRKNNDRMRNTNFNALTVMNERYRVAFDIALLLILLSIGFSLEFAEPYEKFLNENLIYRLRYPMKKNSVPTAVLPFISIVFPLLCIFLCSKMDTSGRRARSTAASLGLLLSVAISFVFVNSVKQACGNYRPDFAARCWGSATADPVWKEYGKPDCGNLENESLLNDVRQGRRSFPSGHTSMSFSGLFYLSLYLMYYLKCFGGSRTNTERTEAFVWKVLISLAPLSVAVGVAITRIRDMWHHPEDVIVGSLLGAGTSAFAFSLQGFSVSDTNTSSNLSKYQRLNAEGVNDASLEDDNEEDERTNMAVRPSSMLNLNEM
jgi:membrane-associated phospholipid phosphatase